MEQRRAPTNRCNGRQYEEFRNARGKWMWLDGAWRETRCPTKDEAWEIDGAAQNLDFGEQSDKTYGEVATWIGFRMGFGGINIRKCGSGDTNICSKR